MEDWKDRCLTCNHWRGDREKTLQRIKECGPIVMDLEKGFAASGLCDKKFLWAEIEIDGDASVSLEVPASFGCVLHSGRGQG